MDNRRKGSLAVGAILLALLMGNALTGMSVVGYHPECIDQDDNDQDGFVDGMDQECAEYPYADGNGEDFTPMNERSTDDAYESLFEYHIDHMVTGTNEQIDTICANIVLQLYDEADNEAALQWENDNQANCAGSGP